MNPNEKLGIALAALREIVITCEDVCDDFLEFGHPVCASSARAWLIACTAIKMVTDISHEKDSISATTKHQL